MIVSPVVLAPLPVWHEWISQSGGRWIAAERPYLRRALEFYAKATDADWNNDHGFNANAALGNLEE